MRILLDATSAVDQRKTGVGWYTWHLIRWLPEVDPETTYLAWYLHFRGLFNRRRFFEPQPNLIERGTALPARLYMKLSNRLEMPRVEWFAKFDSFLAPNYIPPATRTKGLVVTVHDLAFRILPETAPHANKYWLMYLERTLKQAAEIITVSQSTKEDLVDLYGVDPERVTAVHSGIELDVFHAVSDEVVGETKQRLGIDGPYLLFVGGIEPRKNIRGLLRAFSRLDDDVMPKLVIAGATVPWIPGGTDIMDSAVRALPENVRERIVQTGYVSEADKVALLTGAEALAYPSIYEGFGFPVLEAMACGTPVLTSNMSSLPEVAGDAALLVDPHETSQITDGMDRLLRDSDLRKRLSEAGRTRAGQFSWKETARNTAKVLHRAAERT